MIPKTVKEIILKDADTGEERVFIMSENHSFEPDRLWIVGHFEEEAEEECSE